MEIHNNGIFHSSSYLLDKCDSAQRHILDCVCLHTLLQVTRYTTTESQLTLRRKMHMYKIYKRQEKESIHVGFPSSHNLRASRVRCRWNKDIVVWLTTCCGRRL